MWRFAVVIKQQQWLFNRISLETIRRAPKHTDSTSYSRFLSSDASAMRIEQDTPVREVFSLDDFGLLTRSSSLQTMSSIENDQSFLDQLFRYDTLSSIQIPTTVDSNQLGGSNELFGYDQAVELLSEGADAQLVAEELEEITSNDHTYYFDQKPSTSKTSEDVVNLPFLIPNIEQIVPNPLKTRSFLSEKVRRERKLNLSTTTIEEEHPKSSEFIPNVGEMMFPESLPVQNFTSDWSTLPSSSQPVVIEESAPVTEIILETLENLVAENNIMELKSLLLNGTWPEYLFSEEQRANQKINRILRFFVKNCESVEDAELAVKKVASSLVQVTISDDILITLSANITKYSSNIQIVEKLNELSQVCTLRDLRPNISLMKAARCDLYTSVLQKAPGQAYSVHQKCTELNFDRSVEDFLRCFSDNAQKMNENFEKSFGAWKKMSSKFGTTSGIENFWLMALKDESAKSMAVKIDNLMKHSNKSDHPFTTMAHLICALIRLNEMPKAIEVFKTVSISGRHFRTPLALFVESNDLENIERLGELIEKGIIGDRRRGGTRDKSDKTDVSLIDEEMFVVLAKFYGLNGRKKKTFTTKKVKRKIHRVDEEQLHELCFSLQSAWINCAVKSNDAQSAKRLEEWCMKNRIEIDEKVMKKINSFLKL